MKKTRVDERLTLLGLAESRSKAQAFIGAGEVFTRAAGKNSEDSWEPVQKASQIFPEGQEFQIRSKSSGDVGRGALKLRGALEAWPEISVTGAYCLDIGASTGGFTQVLLENGATKVVALDVGTHQLHERLRADPRVHSLEQQHVLHCDAAYWRSKGLSLPFDLLVTDLSFISLEKVIPHAAPWVRPGGHWILLVKPQFELDRSRLHKGIVKDEKARQEAVNKIREVVRSLGPQWQWRDLVPSPIKGGDGNVEFLLWLHRRGD
jgi:23S rRNA (cytidine1920-2'-O)/16S rRNA (cytidine1409-2'-O)-methyltransferase